MLTTTLAITVSIYAAAGMIASVEPCNDGTQNATITIATHNGLYAVVQDPEDLYEGDIVTFLMNDNGTPWNVYDDVVYPDTFRCQGYVDGGLIYVGGEPVGAVFE